MKIEMEVELKVIRKVESPVGENDMIVLENGKFNSDIKVDIFQSDSSNIEIGDKYKVTINRVMEV